MKSNEPKHDVKQKILETAERLFKDLGYKRTTFRMIADEVGIATATISYHFKNKNRLLYEIYSNFFELVSNYVRANLTEGFNYYLFYSIVYIHVYREIMKRESNWQLFYHKGQIEIWEEDKAYYFQERYRLISDDFRKDLTDDEINMAAIMDVGAKRSIFKEFTSGESNLTVDKCCYYHAYVLGEFSKLDEATIEKNIARAFDFVNSHELPTIFLLE